MDVFQKLNDNGISIVMVTHELDIARYTKRTIIMRDGVVVSDAEVDPRSDAREELRRLDEEHQTVQLTS